MAPAIKPCLEAAFTFYTAGTNSRVDSVFYESSMEREKSLQRMQLDKRVSEIRSFPKRTLWKNRLMKDISCFLIIKCRVGITS